MTSEIHSDVQLVIRSQLVELSIDGVTGTCIQPIHVSYTYVSELPQGVLTIPRSDQQRWLKTNVITYITYITCITYTTDFIS